METRFCYRTPLYEDVRRFYEQVLHWPIYNEWNRSATDRGVVYHAGTALLEVLLSPQEQTTNFTGDFYLYLEVSDLKDLQNLMRVKNYPTTDIYSFEWGHSSFIVRDPAGLSLKFFTKTSDSLISSPVKRPG